MHGQGALLPSYIFKCCDLEQLDLKQIYDLEQLDL